LTFKRRGVALAVVTGLFLAGAGGAMALALSTYNGHTSQHKPIKVVAHSGHVKVQVTFKMNCGGGVYYADNAKASNIRLSSGRFDGAGITFDNSIRGGAYFVHGKFKKLKGRVRAGKAKGVFDVHAHMTASDGEPYAICDTGLVNWTATKG
jgi:hypothetical protein